MDDLKGSDPFSHFPILLNYYFSRRRPHAVVIIAVGVGGGGVGRIDKRMDGDLFFLEKMRFST